MLPMQHFLPIEEYYNHFVIFAFMLTAMPVFSQELKVLPTGVSRENSSLKEKSEQCCEQGQIPCERARGLFVRKFFVIIVEV